MSFSQFSTLFRLYGPKGRCHWPRHRFTTGPIAAQQVGGGVPEMVASTSSEKDGMAPPKSIRTCQPAKSTPLLPVRPDLNFDFLLSPSNLELIERNCQQRKGLGNVRRLHSIWAELQQFPPFGTQKVPPDQAYLHSLWEQLYAEAARLPNMSDPAAPVGAESAARLVEHFGAEMRSSPAAGDEPQQQLKSAEKLVDGWAVLRYPRQTGGGSKSYALIGTLADMERALLDFAFDFIYSRLASEEHGVGGVECLEVDDILPLSTTRACGVQQGLSQHPLQYRVFHSDELFGPDEANVGLQPVDFDELKPSAICLSGTAEMGIAERLKGRIFDEAQLPLYFLVESTCFRPEVSGGTLEGGLYRVHEFKKVEMFAVCTEGQSSAELERLVGIQRDLLGQLRLHCRVLDMPSEELGAPAARKFDIEAWLPGRRAWGELTSASNCTDYQARRLDIRYRPSKAERAGEQPPLRHVHTCNGTGLASTRTIIAMLETCQKQRGLDLPAVIRERMPSRRSAVFKASLAKPIKYNFEEDDDDGKAKPSD